MKMSLNLEVFLVVESTLWSRSQNKYLLLDKLLPLMMCDAVDQTTIWLKNNQTYLLLKRKTCQSLTVLPRTNLLAPPQHAQ